ncbi:unannotated protein [freshwater metagenome]|uniref:Unannotated protein n=1 Tax=freshwater metagenome TaxID=449393 RepID=A0A6J7R3W2_9ZZZZ
MAAEATAFVLVAVMVMMSDSALAETVTSGLNPSSLVAASTTRKLRARPSSFSIKGRAFCADCATSGFKRAELLP